MMPVLGADELDLLFSYPGEAETPDGVDGGVDVGGVVHRFCSWWKLAGMLGCRSCIPAGVLEFAVRCASFFRWYGRQYVRL